jgi:ATP-dependent Lon protease
MTIIETKPLSLDDKMVVARNHLIPQISKLVDFEPSEIIISDEEIETLICDYTCEAGARQLKKMLESLIQELNLRRLMEPKTSLLIDRFLINDVFKHRDKVRRESISDKPLIGQINGMWANALGMGGILPIQVEKTYTSKTLVLTGTQGDTMKESMRCAETIAINLTTNESPNFNKEDLKFGLHIHCPSTGMPKDGPSAGGAICIAVFSFLCNKYIKQDVAMTGEIDLMGRILAIGGLDAKLNGAKKAGIRKALIPLENKEQFQRMINEGKNPEDEKFKVVMVDNIYEALNHFL